MLSVPATAAAEQTLPCAIDSLPSFEFIKTEKGQNFYKSKDGVLVLSINCLQKTDNLDQTELKLRPYANTKKWNSTALSYRVDKGEIHTITFLLFGKDVLQVSLLNPKKPLDENESWSVAQKINEKRLAANGSL